MSLHIMSIIMVQVRPCVASACQLQKALSQNDFMPAWEMLGLRKYHGKGIVVQVSIKFCQLSTTNWKQKDRKKIICACMSICLHFKACQHPQEGTTAITDLFKPPSLSPPTLRTFSAIVTV